MKKNLLKYLLLLVTLSLCFLLAGCYVPPDDVSDSNVISGANNLPFDVVPTDTPAVNLPVVSRGPTNAPAPSGGISIDWNNWGSTTNPDSTQGSATNPPTGRPTTVGVKTAPPVATATKSQATTPPTVMKKGSKGDNVKSVQKRLKELGYLKGSADGDFGDATETAVIAFQKNNGLKADGVVGAQTLAKINSSSAKKATTTTTNTTTAKATAKPVTKATANPTATPNVENKYLSSGSSGKDVKQMQTRLIQLGWLSGTADGEYGAATEAAVLAFQKKCGLWTDGKAGPNTLKLLYSSSAAKSSTPAAAIGDSLKRGSSGEAVRTLQKKLKDLGYLKGSADGTFGEATEAAVIAFQQANGLKVDGKAGTATLDKLFSSDVSTAPAGGNEGKVTSGDQIASTGYASLREGSTGSAVKDLQNKLKALGYYTGSVDGKYGKGTTTAVTAFQHDRHLKEDGIAGPATQRALYGTESTISYATLRMGDSGSAVSNLQYTLYELGYYDGAIDGKYGQTTKDAVQAFQGENNLDPVDGIAGNKTLQRLYSSSAVSATTPVTSFPALQSGDSGNEVVQLQDVLRQLGYMKSDITGVYDYSTEQAVMAFQQRNGLKVDGKAGSETLSRLYSDNAIVAQ